MIYTEVTVNGNRSSPGKGSDRSVSGPCALSREAKVKNIQIIVNEEKDEGLVLTGSITEYLKKRGIEAKSRMVSRNEVLAFDREHPVECLITLGGDGTFIQAACKAAESGIPIFGINLGNVGYLTEVEKDNIFPALDRLLEGRYVTENRMMLSGTCTSDETGEEPKLALNDIVISRHGSLRAVRYELFVNNRLLNTYDADGMIVSTPTGSTGYNLSAGGPIVEPTARMILVNPICPHTLNTRAIVLSADDTVRVRVVGGRFPQEYEAEVSFDGGRTKMLGPRQEVTVSCATVEARFIRLGEESFLDILSRKMRDR